MQIVSIGLHPLHIRHSVKTGEQCFFVPSHIWDKFSLKEKWEANERFLKRIVKNKKIVRLLTPVDEIPNYGHLRLEYNFLTNHGYVLSTCGKFLQPNE